ncbi:MAG: hypothetical protein IJU95_03430 [Treponema sp.]|nr:hypothetical protein [Treponema sp.]
MKKMTCSRRLLLVASLALFSAFAQAKDWEISLSYENTFKNTDVLRVSDDDITYLGLEEFTRTTKTPMGAKGTIVNFLGSPFGFADLGFGVDGSICKFNTYTFSDFDTTGNSEVPDLDIDLGNGMEYNIGVGPVLRLNLGRRHSFSFFPSALFTLRRSEFTKPDEWGVAADAVTVKLEERNIGYNFNIGYRCWVIAKPTYLVGLNLGVDFQSVKFSHSSMDYGGTKFEYKTDNQTTAKFFVGISINLGTRGVDRLVAQRDAEDAGFQEKPEKSKKASQEK